MIKNMFKKAFETFRRKPAEICGFTFIFLLLKGAAAFAVVLPVMLIALLLSASGGIFVYYSLGSLLSRAGDSLAWIALIVSVIGIFAVTIILACAFYVFDAGLYKMYLNYTKKSDYAGINNLFDGFRQFWHITLGGLWKALWLFLWLIIPLAGPVLMVYKAYCYRFNTLVLLENPDMSVRQCLKTAMKKANGKKGSMFLCDIILNAVISAVPLVSWSFSSVPYVICFIVLPLSMVSFVISFFGVICSGLLTVSFYTNECVSDDYTESGVSNDIKDNYFLNCKQYDGNIGEE